MSSKRIIGVEERVPAAQLIPLSIQHVFAMFGASVLVPILFGISSGIVLFMNGVGTLLFIFLTKGKAPAYLGSSFAFLAPASVIIAEKGFEYAQGGFVVVGLLGCVLAFVIYKCGTAWIDVVLPPAAMGPVVALIGLELASNTVKGGAIGADLMTVNPAGGLMLSPTISWRHILVFAVTLLMAVFGSVLFRKFLSVIPLLVAMVVGYLTALAVGLMDFSAFAGITMNPATWLRVPAFHLAKFDLNAIATMVPVLLVITAEHVGHQIVTGNIVGRDLIKDPGLHRSLFADGLSNVLSGLVGSTPNTTYGENMGVMAITGVYSTWVIGGAAVFAILFSFIGKIAALIHAIPTPVMGGVCILLFGFIAASGLRMLVEKKVDYTRSKNLILTAVTMISGLSGATIILGPVQLKGMGLATVVAMVMSLVFLFFEKIHWANE